MRPEEEESLGEVKTKTVSHDESRNHRFESGTPHMSHEPRT